jgi:Lipopolysaccharide kinase (Kdo/WaaP) family
LTGFRIVTRNGWRLAYRTTLIAAPDVIDAALELATGAAVPFRRSRHASTFLLRSPAGQTNLDLFVKFFDAPAGWERVKSWCRRSRPSRTQRITAALSAADFRVPQVVLYGEHRRSRRELIATSRAEGEGPILTMRELGGSVTAKRAILHGLGAEVARLHMAGFIHGDLTPFNIRIAIDEPPRFAFIDNDRTCRKIVARRYHRMRNLVQLGRFDLPGINRTDRMRVLRAYEAALNGCHSRAFERKVAARLRRWTQAHLST